MLEAEAERFVGLVSHLPQFRIAINIGGSSKGAVIDKGSAEKIVEKLGLLAKRNDCGPVSYTHLTLPTIYSV